MNCMSPLKQPRDREVNRVRRRARAKINLYLHVVGRRPDGFHDLDSLIASATSTSSPKSRLQLDYGP